MKLRLIHHAKNEGRAWDSKHLDDHTTEEEEEKLRTGGFDTPMRYSIDRALAMYLLWKLLTDPQEG